MGGSDTGRTLDEPLDAQDTADSAPAASDSNPDVRVTNRRPVFLELLALLISAYSL
jgi:hypothetical protein